MICDSLIAKSERQPPGHNAASAATRYKSEARAKIGAGLGVFIRSDAIPLPPRSAQLASVLGPRIAATNSSVGAVLST